MSLSLVTTAVLRAAEETGDPAVPAWVIGLIAFGILMSLLIGLVSFGGGREHS
ncbi:hypothetical protein BH09ACT12_BH09ACT12_16690 [soil metagenome]